MSIVPGESQGDVNVRPYFRGRAVCSRADTRLGGDAVYQQAHLAGGGKPGKPWRAGSRSHADLKYGWTTGRSGGTSDFSVAARLRLR